MPYSAWTGAGRCAEGLSGGLDRHRSQDPVSHVPTVRISSAEQLDTAATTRLFLHVVEVTGAPGDSASVSITDVASRVRDAIAALDMSAAIQFEERLNATGFDWNGRLFRQPPVDRGGLPVRSSGRFSANYAADVQSGVEDVQYAIALSLCENFRVDMTV